MLPLLQAATPETRRTRLERAVRDLAERRPAGEGRASRWGSRAAGPAT
ncbi:hypothetical protein [Streptomyces prasinosporus]